MINLVILLSLVVVPILAILLLRVNGAIAFMSLCLGSALVQYTSGDMVDLITSFSAKGKLDLSQWVDLVLLVAPLLLVILFTHGNVRGGKRFTNILPAVATGMFTALLVIPLLPVKLQHGIEQLGAWTQLDNLQTSVVIAGAVFSLLFLLITHRNKNVDESKKAHGKH